MPSRPANPSRRPLLVTGACLAAGVLAVFGAINSYQVSRNYSAQFPDLYGGERAQSRFAPLLPQVPESAEVGYITDLDPSQQVYASALLAAQYAVAPRLVVMIDARTRPEWAVGNFSKPQDFAAAGDARGYAMVQDFGNGVVLFRRKS